MVMQNLGIQQVTVNDISVSYQLQGSVDLPVLMFANSLMADMTMWDENVSVFHGSYRILRYDMRGHGDTIATPGPYSLEMLANDAVALLDELHIDQVHFVGISLGGMVGLTLASTQGYRLQSLTVCDTGATLNDAGRAAWNERAKTALSGINNLIDATMERWFTAAFEKSKQEKSKRVRHMMARTTGVGYAGCAAAISGVDLASALQDIKIPSLVINGREDSAWTTENAESLCKSIPGARLEIIENAAHIPNIEQPAKFNSVLMRFLAQINA